MDVLTIDKALELYKILKPHIPEPEDDALEFVGKIVDSIHETNQHKDYVDAVMLMSGRDWY